MAHANASMDELRTIWEQRGIDETLIQVDHKGTILGDAPMLAAPLAWSSLVSELPEATPEHGPLVVLGSELGRGAMGVVHTGTQRSLGREVAIKSPRGGATATQALLREAWISGRLEHPNVIPVYALYREDQSPLLVMRRVGGRDWSLALEERDAVETHLRTLVQVCHAVHFAHTRGIVHLDLKPSNIMIGHYGELYLLDWGIAVCMHDDFPAFLPRARDVQRVMGTPAYMAPELATGDGEAIDARTDVYLLGAILYEILTGAPPHVNVSLFASITSAFLSEPPSFPAHVPSELAAIATRALSRDPDDRYPSAAAFREALEDYLLHADSLGLAAAANARFDRIVALLAARRDESAAEAQPEIRAEVSPETDIDALAAEAEFGFRQALHVWPENTAARASLQALLERLIEYDLDRKRWQVAHRRLVDLPEPRPALEQRVNALRAASTRAMQELEQLRGDADLDLSARQRSIMAYIAAFLWTVTQVGLGLADHYGVVRAVHWHMLAITVGGTGVFAGLVYVFRKALFANAISRNAVALLSVGWILGDLFWVGAWVVDMSFEEAAVGVAPITVFVIAGHAASVDRRLVLHATLAVIGYVTIFFLPEFGLELIGLTGGVVLTLMGRTWGQRSQPE